MSWVGGEFVPASTCCLGGGPAGAGGSGAGGPAASAYTPTAQPQADIAYQGIVQNLFPYANDPSTTPAGKAYSTLNPYGQQLANQGLINQGMQGAQNAYQNYQQGVYPAAQNLGQAIPTGAINQYNLASNNPYANQAIQGALTGSGYGSDQAYRSATAASYLNSLAPQLIDAGAGAAGNINALASPAINIGSNAQANLYGLAPQALQTGLNTQQNINAAINPLQGLSQQLINTGFDPQQALYNRTQQQVTDQARAAAAASGMAGTPYGTGVENQALSNFNIDWQNQQLARQAQAASSAQGIQGTIGGLFGAGGQAAAQGIGQTGGLYGAGAGLAQQGLTSGANLYGQGLGALTSGAQAGAGQYGAGMQLGAGATNLAQLAGGLPSSQYMGNLAQQTQLQNAIAGLAQSGLNIGTQGAQGLATFAGQPYSALGTAINNVLTPGLGNIAQLGQQQFQLPQQVLNDLQSYLGLGQSASQLSGYLGNLGLQQTAQALGGVGQALGGVNSLFGGGSSGGSGLLGSLFGGGAGAAGADVTGLLSPAASAAFPAFDATTQTLLSGGGAAAAGGGIGDFLASILPFAAAA